MSCKKPLPPHLRPILAALRRRKWVTALDIVRWGYGHPFSVTSRIRDLRKGKYGGFAIETKKFDGIYHYNLSE